MEKVHLPLVVLCLDEPTAGRRGKAPVDIPDAIYQDQDLEGSDTQE